MQGGHAFAYSLPEGKTANMLLLYGDFGGNEYAEGLIGAAGHRLCAEKRPNWDGITLYGTAGGDVSIQNWAGSAATPKGDVTLVKGLKPPECFIIALQNTYQQSEFSGIN